jgi:hypothetical protein
MGDYLQWRDREKTTGKPTPPWAGYPDAPPPEGESWAAWAEGVGLEPVQRRTRAGRRHDDGPPDLEWARRQDRQRWTVFWIGVGLLLSVPFVGPLLGAW